MHKNRAGIAIASCLFALTLTASAQANRKPGLWEMTSNMTWQQSPMPAGMQMPPGAPNPFAGGPRTNQVCLTQAMIDKYGAPMPQSRNNSCQIANVQMKPAGMTADWICTGQMAGQGSLESSWTDPDRAVGKVHFVGTMSMGQRSMPIEYTIESTSVYKGSDCGSVKPPPMPSN